jgi:pantoate kinase
MPTAAHFKNFRLSSLGFSRVVALEDVMSGEEALSCEEDDIAEAAALRSVKKSTGLAAKRAAAAGGDVAPPVSTSPLIVVRNVELRCVCLAGSR